jgi:hypothetical protein
MANSRRERNGAFILAQQKGWGKEDLVFSIYHWDEKR